MKAVILAAGEGVRLRPLTLTKPKALLPVGNIPVIQHVLDSVKKNGVKEVLIVVGYLGEKIQSLVRDGSKFGLKVNYVWQKHVGGTGEALSLVSDFLDETFLVVYGDLYVTSSAIKKVLQTYKRRRSSVLALVEVENPKDYGVVKIDKEKRLMSIEEKPEKPSTNLVNAGIYVFTKEIFGEIAKTKESVRGEVELTDAIQSLAKKGLEVYTVKLGEDEWVDLGKPWDLLKANEKFLGKMKRRLIKGKLEKNVKIKGPVKVEANAVLKDGVYVEGPVIVGAGSVVGPNCYLRAYTCLGRDVRVGAGCEIKNCIVMDKTKIPHLSYFGDSIIGENCNFGAGTLVANLRFDKKNVKAIVRGEVVDTGRKKFGVVVGDNVQTGINVSLMPGIKIGPNSQIGPNISLHRDIPANTRILLKQTLKFEEIG
jgi:bifunctional UDP-N-acetylglucosamine pyrophosphorylase/glucosamine-1-phosphate N-acetyltransferase